MAKTRKLALMAVLTAAALTIFMLESQLPPVAPIHGVKLGLANIITLTAMLLLGRREAGAILAVRILMGAAFAGSPASLLYSGAGGVAAYLLMVMTVKLFPEKQLWIVSALAGIAHNAGQLAACVLIVKTPGVLVYAPVLAASGVITGCFTGFAAMYLVRTLKKLRF